MGIAIFATLALALGGATLAEGSPIVTPPAAEANPGASLSVGIALGQDNGQDLAEYLVSATWTEDGGTIERSKLLNSEGDVIDYMIPGDALHCTTLTDSVTVEWEQCGTSCTPQPPITASFSLTVMDPMTLSPATMSISGSPGSTRTIELDISGGRAPYQAATSANGATVSLSGSTLTYEIPVGATSDYQDRVTISGASAGDPCGGNSASISIAVSLTATALTVVPESANLGSFQPGQTVQTSFTVSGGLPGYSVTLTPSLSGASVNAPSTSGGTGTFSYTIPADAQPGSTSLTIQISDSGEGRLQQQATASITFSVEAQETGNLSASPSDISFSATSQAGSPTDVTKTFAVSGGTAPYSLSVASISGGLIGRVEPSTLASAGTATYVVRVPANAPSNLTFANSIQITDANGNTTSVTVQANVTAATTLATRPDLTPNQRSVAQSIETLCPKLGAMSNRTAEEEDLFVQCSAMLNNPTASGIPNTLEQITNQKANAAKTAGIRTGTQQFANIASRLSAIRSGSAGLDISALTLNSGGQALSGSQLAALAASGLSGGGASADTFGRWGFFVNGTVDFGNRNTTSNETGYDFNTTGITGGVDYRFTDNFVAGGAVGFAQQNIDFDSDDGGLDTKTWHIAAYATSYLSERTYVDAILEYGWNDYDSQRNIDYQINSNLEAVRRRAKADYSGSQFGASLGAGYDMNQGPLAYGLYGKVAYVSVRVDDFREKNAGGLGLTMDSFDANSLTTVLGARISRVINTSRAVLVPQARFEWEHEYDNDASRLTARFATDPSGTQFSIYTDDPDRDYFRIGLGLSAVFPRGITSFVNYDTMLDKRNWVDHRIDAGVRWEFY